MVLLTTKTEMNQGGEERMEKEERRKRLSGCSEVAMCSSERDTVTVPWKWSRSVGHEPRICSPSSRESVHESLMGIGNKRRFVDATENTCYANFVRLYRSKNFVSLDLTFGIKTLRENWK